MSRSRLVTFIGGSQDLTRRVLDEELDCVKFAKFLPTHFNGPRHVENLERPFDYKEEIYRLFRVGEDHWVGVLEELCR